VNFYISIFNSNSKKFIFLCLLISIVLFGTFSYIVTNHKMLFMNQEYPLWVNVKETMSSKFKEKQNVIMIGDSRGKAGFIPNLNQSIQSLNLSVGGGTPIEGYYTLKKYLQYNAAPNKLIISYSPCHLEEQDAYWDRTVKCNFLELKDYQEVEANAKIINDSTTLGISKKYTDYTSPIKYTNDFLHGVFSMRWKKNKEVLTSVLFSKGHYYCGKANYSNELNKETTKEIFIKSPLIDLYFQKFLELAKRNHISIYYYSMPFNESSFNAGKAQYRTEYDNYILKTAYQYNIKVCNKLNYMTNDNFGDDSHLYKGAKQASEAIFNCVDN
jgi:hypothetical protein